MKKYLYIILAGLLLTGTVKATSPYIFQSSQEGLNPVNGYYLKTDGTISTWSPVTAGTNATSTEPLMASWFVATSTTATSTFSGGLSVAGGGGLTVYNTGGVVIGNSANGGQPYRGGLFGTTGKGLTISDNVNDLINGVAIVNMNTGVYTATCFSLLNANSTNNVILGMLPTYFGGLCYSGPNFAAFSGLQANGLGLVSTDGGIVIAATSPNTASSSVAFGSGPGYAAGNYDMIIKTGLDGFARVGIGTTSPWGKLSLAKLNLLDTQPAFVVGTSTLTSTSTAFIIDSNGKVGIGTSSPSGTNSLAVQGTSYFGGNVGIGTSTPPRLLSVQGGQTSFSGTGYSTAVSHYFGYTTGTYTLGIGTGNGALKAFVDYNGSVTGFGSASGNDFMIAPNGGNVIISNPVSLIVKTDGKVGIGSTTPSHRLFVSSTNYNDIFAIERVSGSNTNRYGFTITGSPGVTNNILANGSLTVQALNQSSDIAFMPAVGGDPLVTIKSSGKVGIGTSSPATSLDVNGTITQLTVKSCTLGLTTDALGSITGCVASDKTLKSNIILLTSGKEILNLRPVFYEWKDKKKDNGQVHAGFIAQEVEKAIPEAVVPAGTNLKGVDFNAILAYTVKFIQNFWKQFQSLVARVSGLESRLNEQQKQINNLQAEINQLKK